MLFKTDLQHEFSLNFVKKITSLGRVLGGSTRFQVQVRPTLVVKF